MSSQKKANGRPSLYKPEYCDLLLQNAKDGFSFQAFGGLIGVSGDTLYRWLKEYPEFSEARKKSKMISQRALEQEGIDLTKGRYGKNASTAAWIFRMRNICGWQNEPTQENEEDNWEIE